MMARAADDFDAIRARLLELRGDTPTEYFCPECEGDGWVAYGIGKGDPHFKECETCGNPNNQKSP